MAKKAVEQHVHKLKRIKYKSGNASYFCCLPDCSYKVNPPLALGKRTICWRCGEPFIMTEYSIRLAKPHCENCHKPKNQVDIHIFPSAANETLDSEEPLAATGTENSYATLANELFRLTKESPDDEDI